jgi:hypothetical protein
MSLARARKRKLAKKANKGTELAKHRIAHADKTIGMSYVERYKIELTYRKEVINNLWLIYRYVMYEKYGFGRERQIRLRDKTWNEFEAIMAGYVSVPEIDKFFKEEIDFDCGLCTMDPKADRQKRIEDIAIRDLSAAFLMALLDEFNYKAKKLVNICHYTFEINDKILKNELTYDDIQEKLNKVMERGRKKK